MSVVIKEVDGVLCVKDHNDWRTYCWRRVSGEWEMRGESGNWFKCEIQAFTIARMVADFENCLRSYAADEGPEYPRKNKKGQIGKFFRSLQLSELRAGSKNIFAPVKIKYDAHAENRARFNREYSYSRLSRPGEYENHLTR